MLKFELIKIFREKTTYFLFVLFVLIISIPIFLGNANFSYVKYYEDNYYAGITTIESIKDDPTATKIVEDIKETNGYLKKLIDSLKKGDQKAIVENEYNLEKKTLEGILDGSLQARPISEQKSIVAVLEYLKNNGLNKTSDNPKKMGVIQYLNLVFSSPQLMQIILILINFQIAYLFNLDYKKHNFIWYCVSSNSYVRTYYTKLFAIVLSLFANLLSAFLLVLAFVFLKNGLGVFNYPIATSSKNTEVSLIATGDFVVKTIFFFILFLAFLALLSLVFSILTSNLILNLSVLIIPLVIGQYDVLNTLLNENLKPYILLSYLDMPHILLGGDIMRPLRNPLLTYQNGILMTLLTILVLVIISLTILLFPSQRLIAKKTRT